MADQAILFVEIASIRQGAEQLGFPIAESEESRLQSVVEAAAVEMKTKCLARVSIKDKEAHNIILLIIPVLCMRCDLYAYPHIGIQLAVRSL